MARHGQVLPPVPAPGSNALCRIVLLSIASPGFPRNSRTYYPRIRSTIGALTATGGTLSRVMVLAMGNS